jgi:anaerobic magnesium-protoporphyrin IX monomethyl ester cyclase
MGIMRVLLLNPSGSSPVAPPLGLTTLYSFIKNRGYEISQMDICPDLFHDCCNPDKIEKVFKKARKKIKFLKLLSICYLFKTNVFRSKRDWAKKKKIDSLLILFSRLSSEFEKSMVILRTVWQKDGFIDLKSNYKFTLRAITNILLLYTYIYPKWIVNYAKRSMHNSEKELLKHPFNDYYDNILIPKIKSINPGLIGISLTYSSQIPFALTMIKAIHKAGIKCPLVVGGSAFTLLCNKPQDGNGKSKRTLLSESLHSLLQPFGIIYDGELPLLSLCDALKRKEHLNLIPNLVRKDTNHHIFINQKGIPLNPVDYPDIELDGLPMGKKYITPIPFVNLRTANRCYWKKCAFCVESGDLHSKDSWKEAIPHRIAENIECFVKKYNIGFINFCDNAMSPRMIQGLSEELIKRKVTVKWGSMVRFDKALSDVLTTASEAGCFYFGVGLESGCQKTLDKMRKGYKLEIIQNLLDECYAKSIKVHLSVIFGFPGEKLDEAQETINFLLKNDKKTFSLLSNAWSPLLDSAAVKESGCFGVKFRKEDQEVLGYSTYMVDHGMTKEEAFNVNTSFRTDHRFRNKNILNQINLLPDETKYLIAICK